MPPPNSGIVKVVLVEEIAEYEEDGWEVIGRRKNPCGVHTIPVTHRQGDWPSVMMRKEEE